MFNDDIKILDRHKKNITCDACNKQIWFFQKAVRLVRSVKNNVWAEYYHIKCIQKVLTKYKPKDNKDKDEDEPSTSNLVH